MKLFEFFKKYRWTRGTEAIDSKGNDVEPTSKKACAFCLLGAMRRIHPKSKTKYDRVRNNLLKAINGTNDVDIINFNDGNCRDKRQLMRVLEKNNI